MGSGKVYPVKYGSWKRNDMEIQKLKGYIECNGIYPEIKTIITSKDMRRGNFWKDQVGYCRVYTVYFDPTELIDEMPKLGKEKATSSKGYFEFCFE